MFDELGNVNTTAAPVTRWPSSVAREPAPLSRERFVWPTLHFISLWRLLGANGQEAVDVDA